MLNLPLFKQLSLLLIILLLSACTTANIPYHTNSTHKIAGEFPKAAGIERHKNYDLGFVEFSDRGNVFDRSQMDNVLALVQQHAHAQGATVITYIHGWKHNAHPDDGNLEEFHRLLKNASAKQLSRQRRLIGIFIGWRGLSIKTAGIKNLTYWSRKKVAHDVGNGGITELLLKLEHSLYYDQNALTKNVLINIGHSMGGAILLSALNDVLMEKILDTQLIDGCIKTRPFGHANLLINPAVEANEIFQLKELVKQNPCYAATQNKLLHIISSDADMANKFAFKIGQWFGVSLPRKETTLLRRYSNNEHLFKIKEKDLDTITIANFPMFHTGRSVKRNSQNQALCTTNNTDRKECYISCEGQHECVVAAEKKHHIPVVDNEPLSFVYTDKEFMGSHTDIFNPNIAGYIATITEESQSKYLRSQNKNLLGHHIEKDCLNEENQFKFGQCFDFFRKVFISKQSIPSKQ